MNSLKIEVDKLDIHKLVPVPVDLSKLSDVVKKIICDKLVAKVNSIDTSAFVLKNEYDTDKTELENKIPDTSSLVKKTDYNTKITEIEGKIPDISSLAIKTALAAADKIPDASSLVQKTDYNTKVTETENKLNNHNHDKYIATPEFNTLADVFNARLARTFLVAKTNFDNTVSSLDSKIAANKTKNESLENEIKSLRTLDLSYFIGKSHFEEDGTQNYLVSQPINIYSKVIANKLYISSWRSKGLSDKTIKPPVASDNSLTPLNDYVGNKITFTRSCSK